MNCTLLILVPRAASICLNYISTQHKKEALKQNTTCPAQWLVLYFNILLEHILK